MIPAMWRYTEWVAIRYEGNNNYSPDWQTQKVARHHQSYELSIIWAANRWIKTLILKIQMLSSKAKPELYSVLDDPQENFNVAGQPENAEVMEKELCELKNTIRDGESTAQ